MENKSQEKGEKGQGRGGKGRSHEKRNRNALQGVSRRTKSQSEKNGSLSQR